MNRLFRHITHPVNHCFLRRSCCLLLALLCCFSLSAAEPLTLAPDLAGELVTPYQADAPEGESYTYRWAYPQIAGEDPSAELINSFYQYLVDDALGFGIPMLVDYYASLEESVSVEISYQVTCNNDSYFSVLIENRSNDYVSYSGNTFSRLDAKPGSSVALPYLLGILETDESDTWLQDRQTAKADELVRSMVWALIEENADGIAYHEEFTEESFSEMFYPEEDFYLDESGNPVFFLEPGYAAPSGFGLLRFPLLLEDILDEM